MRQLTENMKYRKITVLLASSAFVVAAAPVGGGAAPVAASSQTEIATPFNTPAGTPNWKDRLDAVQAAKKAAAGGGKSGSGGSGGAGGGSGGGSGGPGAASAAQSRLVAQPLAIAGNWLWAQGGAEPSLENKVGDGVLMIYDLGIGNGVFEGAILGQPFEKTPDAENGLVQFPLRGTFDGAGGADEEAYSFLVVNPENGDLTRSRVVLSADKKTLKGQTVDETPVGTMTFEWKAIRLPIPEEK